jgi:hypothetical protein
MSGVLKGEYADSSWTYRWRTNKLVRAIRKFLLNNVISPLGTFSVLYLTLALGSHLLFKFIDAAGLFCQEKQSPADVRLRSYDEGDPYLIPGEERQPIVFQIDSLCYDTDVKVIEGELYDITIKQKQPPKWQDGSQDDVSLGGFSAFDVNRYSAKVGYIVATPFRRILTQPWLKMVLRVGRTGAYEEFVAPDPNDPSQASKRLRFKSSGELFLYVNDAVLPVPEPRLAGIFYRHPKNSGTAEVQIRRVKLDSTPQ